MAPNPPQSQLGARLRHMTIFLRQSPKRAITDASSSSQSPVAPYLAIAEAGLRPHIRGSSKALLVALLVAAACTAVFWGILVARQIWRHVRGREKLWLCRKQAVLGGQSYRWNGSFVFQICFFLGFTLFSISLVHANGFLPAEAQIVELALILPAIFGLLMLVGTSSQMFSHLCAGSDMLWTVTENSKHDASHPVGQGSPGHFLSHRWDIRRWTTVGQTVMLLASFAWMLIFAGILPFEWVHLFRATSSLRYVLRTIRAADAQYHQGQAIDFVALSELSKLVEPIAKNFDEMVNLLHLRLYIAIAWAALLMVVHIPVAFMMISSLRPLVGDKGARWGLSDILDVPSEDARTVTVISQPLPRRLTLVKALASTSRTFALGQGGTLAAQSSWVSDQTLRAQRLRRLYVNLHVHAISIAVCIGAALGALINSASLHIDPNLADATILQQLPTFCITTIIGLVLGLASLARLLAARRERVDHARRRRLSFETHIDSRIHTRSSVKNLRGEIVVHKEHLDLKWDPAGLEMVDLELADGETEGVHNSSSTVTVHTKR